MMVQHTCCAADAPGSPLASLARPEPVPPLAPAPAVSSAAGSCQPGPVPPAPLPPPLGIAVPRCPRAAAGATEGGGTLLSAAATAATKAAFASAGAAPPRAPPPNPLPGCSMLSPRGARQGHRVASPLTGSGCCGAVPTADAVSSRLIHCPGLGAAPGRPRCMLNASRGSYALRAATCNNATTRVRGVLGTAAVQPARGYWQKMFRDNISGAPIDLRERHRTEVLQ